MKYALYSLIMLICFLSSCITQKTVSTNHESLGADKAILLQQVQEDESQSMKEKTPDTELLWDEWGVPHIYARNNEDLN